MISMSRAARLATPLTRRQLSTNKNTGLGTLNRPGKPLPSDSASDGDVTSAVVTGDIKLRNAALAAALFAFTFGVAQYSMTKVGQAGGSEDDPLAALRQEAKEAKDKQEREEKLTEDATEMYQRFQAGDYDPDKYEEDEEDLKKTKRPWWKIW